MVSYTTDAAFLTALKDARQKLVVGGYTQVTVDGVTYQKIHLQSLERSIAALEAKIANAAGSTTPGGARRNFVAFDRS